MPSHVMALPSAEMSDGATAEGPETSPPAPPMPEYKGAPLDAERGPGLGCFWIQVVLLVALLVLTPLSVVWAAPSWLSAALLILSLVILFFVGQTMIFLLRLVAADRRSRRRPLRPDARQTVGQLEDESPVRQVDTPVETASAEAPPPPPSGAAKRGVADDPVWLSIYFVLAVLDGLIFGLLARTYGLTVALYAGGWISIVLALLIRRSFRRVLWAELAFGAVALITYLLVRSL